MIKAYYTAINGAMSSQNYLDVLSNNMANVQTEGFKKSKPEFSDLLYTNIRSNDIKAGSGAKINKVDVVFTQGTPVRTGISTDFSIQGDGFFAIQFEGENLYTRGGSFQITNIEDENYLTYQGGYVLNKEEEPIIVEDTDDINVGVFIINNNGDLEQAGSNLFKLKNEVGEYSILENPKVMKGFIEASNVEVSEEMIKLIQIQRAFQLNSTVVKTADEIEQTINNLKG